MVFIIFSFIFLGAGFLFGFLPIIGPILLGLGVESFLWGVRRRVPDGSLTMDGRFFFVMTVLGLLANAFIFFEPAPGLALCEPVPGMLMTQASVFIIMFTVFRSNRT